MNNTDNQYGNWYEHNSRILKHEQKGRLYSQTHVHANAYFSPNLVGTISESFKNAFLIQYITTHLNKYFNHLVCCQNKTKGIGWVNIFEKEKKSQFKSVPQFEYCFINISL